MKKEILFLCQFFYPEYNSSATLPFDTAKHLAKQGYRVGALCGYPKEYSSRTAVPLKEEKDGVSIKRIRYCQLGRSSKIGRLINYFSFTLSVFLHLFYLKNYRCVVVYSNPPVLPLAAILAHRLFGTKIVFVAYDLYPEVAYASGSLNENSLIDKVMKFINHKMYADVDAVVALTEEMKQFILKNRPETDEERIIVIPNWAHEGCLEPDDNAYASIGFHPSQLIVSYFGNMGTCQDVETMLSAMAELKDREEIQFLIVGHGNKKAYVEQRTRDYRNVTVLDFLTGNAFEYALAVTDIGIVSLEKGIIGMCAPSKYYSYLQSGCAVIAVTEPESYLAKETADCRIGYAVSLNDSDAMVRAILSLSENKASLEQMKRAARDVYRDKYELSVAMKKYDSLFLRIL